MKKKKILINGRFLTQGVTGVQRYATEVVYALDKLIEENIINDVDFEILVPKNYKPNILLENISIKKVGILTGHLWEQLELPIYTKSNKLINLCNTAPILKKKQILTIHDAAVYTNKNSYNWYFILWYKLLYKTLTYRLKDIITVSEFSKKEIIKYCNIKDSSKITVIYEGKEHIINSSTDNNILLKNGLQKDKYLLAVSSLSPNKNFHSIVKAIEDLDNKDFDIVIAGGSDPRIFSKTDDGLLNNVKYVGYVTDEELKSLYLHSACFIFPSLYEGFGLPPLEAMACGCPVIASNTSSIPEVCDDAVIYCDPRDSNTIKIAIEKIMGDNQLRDKLRQKGQIQSNKFSWTNTAIELNNVLKSL